MAGIFTYMTGNRELLGNGLKDKKNPPRGRKWKERLNSSGKGGGDMAGIFTYMTGNWGLEKCHILLGNGLKDRKISPRGRKWEGGLNSPGKGRRSYDRNIYLHDRKLGFWNNATFYWEME
jgi:hypothetical protein